EAALADANAARGMLPDNPFVLATSLDARVIAAGIYQEAKLGEQSGPMLREAKRDAHALEPFRDLFRCGNALWIYYEVTGQRDKALSIARRGMEQTGNPAAVFGSAFGLYCDGKFSEALQCFDHLRQGDPYVDLTRVLVLAELPDGLHRALQA